MHLIQSFPVSIIILYVGLLYLVLFVPMFYFQGFTYPVRSHFLENILEMTGYRLTTYNQIDNYGQDKMWKMQKQTLRKRKSVIASAVEVFQKRKYRGYRCFV